MIKFYLTKRAFNVYNYIFILSRKAIDITTISDFTTEKEKIGLYMKETMKVLRRLYDLGKFLSSLKVSIMLLVNWRDIFIEFTFITYIYTLMFVIYLI